LTILTEALPAGLLTAISADLGVSQAMVRQMITVYAMGSLLSAIPLTAATRGWRRRPLLLVAIGGFLVVNAVTALSTSYMQLPRRGWGSRCAGPRSVLKLWREVQLEG
jgi:predicted MFS family arabinose efflux permease